MDEGKLIRNVIQEVLIKVCYSEAKIEEVRYDRESEEFVATVSFPSSESGFPSIFLTELAERLQEMEFELYWVTPLENKITIFIANERGTEDEYLGDLDPESS